MESLHSLKSIHHITLITHHKHIYDGKPLMWNHIMSHTITWHTCGSYKKTFYYKEQCLLVWGLLDSRRAQEGWGLRRRSAGVNRSDYKENTRHILRHVQLTYRYIPGIRILQYLQHGICYYRYSWTEREYTPELRAESSKNILLSVWESSHL